MIKFELQKEIEVAVVDDATTTKTTTTIKNDGRKVILEDVAHGVAFIMMTGNRMRTERYAVRLDKLAQVSKVYTGEAGNWTEIDSNQLKELVK